MADPAAETRRFFERINLSLTLQMKIAEYSATDYERLWRLAVSLGYALAYVEFLKSCREIKKEDVVPAVWRIISTLHVHPDNSQDE